MKNNQKTLNPKMLRAVIDNAEISINVFDISGKRIFVNPFYYRLAGKPPSSKFTPKLHSGGHKKKGDYITKKVIAAIQSGKVTEIHNSFYKSRFKKTRRYFDYLIGPLRNDKGEIIGAYSMVKDVTSRFLARRNLMKLNTELEKKVRERTEKLEKMNKKLKKISEEKNTIVSDIAHEIKTILTVIKGNFDMMDIEKNVKDPFGLECHGEIEKEIKKMSKIASDLVFIVKSKEYAKLLKMAHFNVIQLIKEAIRNHRKSIGNKFKINLANKLKSKKMATIKGDKAKILTLFGNLIENAVKFGKEDGNLEITVHKDKSMIYIEFKDDGIGIEDEKIDFIFSPFYQTNKSGILRNSRYERGFGLGLAICNKIVTTHNGKIWAESKGLNKGSIFTVSFPTT
jgi:signal transduction histidine kinase